MAIDIKKKGYYGGKYYGEEYYGGRRGIKIEYPIQPFGYKIMFYNLLGIKIGEISSETQNPVLISANFELLTNGCGSWDIILSSLPNELTELAYRYRVNIHLFSDINPWFSGYILKPPLVGSTKIEKEYSGFGFYNQFDDAPILASYTNKQVSSIVHELVRNILEPDTDIVYHKSNIQDTDYMVQNIEWNHVKAKDVFKQLATLAGGYLYGVDENRRFFFRAKNTNINENARWWAGKHLKTFIPEPDYEKIKNRLYIYAKIDTEEGQQTKLVHTENDVASQQLYGIKADKLVLPSILSLADVQQWASYKITELKDPIQKAKITGIELFKEKIDANGKAKITSLDGLTEYELSIERIKYKISSDGLTVDVELGQKDISFTEEQLKIMEKAEILDALNAQT